jgi:hypothetical protein
MEVVSVSWKEFRSYRKLKRAQHISKRGCLHSTTGATSNWFINGNLTSSTGSCSCVDVRFKIARANDGVGHSKHCSKILPPSLHTTNHPRNPVIANQ